MCGRIVQPRSLAELAELFEAFTDADAELARPSFNVAPTDLVPGILLDAAGRRRVRALRWGLEPAWLANGDRAAAATRRVSAGNPSPLINARAETVEENGLFRGAFRARRCIIPADAFYEWRRGEPRLEPHLVKRLDGEPLALGGLFEPGYHGSDGVSLSCAIVTTRPNQLVAALHDRMPLILPRTAWNAWLDPATEPPALRPLLQPLASSDLERYPVSSRVNNVRADGPELIQRAEEPLTLGLA